MKLITMKILSVILIILLASCDNPLSGKKVDTSKVKLVSDDGEHHLSKHLVDKLGDECSRDNEVCIKLARYVEDVDLQSAAEFFLLSCEAGEQVACENYARVVFLPDSKVQLQSSEFFKEKCNLQNPGIRMYASCGAYAEQLRAEGKIDEARNVYRTIPEGVLLPWMRYNYAKVLQADKQDELACYVNYYACVRDVQKACEELVKCGELSEDAKRYKEWLKSEEVSINRQNSVSSEAFAEKYIKGQTDVEKVEEYRSAIRNGFSGILDLHFFDKAKFSDADKISILKEECKYDGSQYYCPGLVDILISNSEFEEAKKVAYNYAKYDPINGFLELGKIYHRTNEFEKAKQLFDYICQYAPAQSTRNDVPEIHKCIYQKFLNESIEGSKKDLTTLTANCQKQDVNSCIELSDIYLNMNRDEEALRVVEEYCDLESGRERINAYACSRIASIYEYHMLNKEKALKLYGELCNDKDPKFNVGRSLNCGSYARLQKEVGDSKVGDEIEAKFCLDGSDIYCVAVANQSYANKDFESALRYSEVACKRLSANACRVRDKVLTASSKDIYSFYERSCEENDPYSCLYLAINKYRKEPNKDSLKSLDRSLEIFESRCKEDEEKDDLGMKAKVMLEVMKLAGEEVPKLGEIKSDSCITKAVVNCVMGNESTGEKLFEEYCEGGHKDSCAVVKSAQCNKFLTDLTK